MMVRVTPIPLGRDAILDGGMRAIGYRRFQRMHPGGDELVPRLRVFLKRTFILVLSSSTLPLF